MALKAVKKDDFVYLDPPYAKFGERNRGEYGVGCFSSADLETLMSHLKRIDVKGAKFCLSYSNDEQLGALISESWYVDKIKVGRSVAGFAAKRASVKEVLITNY